MHDIKFIRENAEAFDEGLRRRGVEPAAAAVLALDTERRAVATRMQEAQNRRNEASKAIGAAKARKADDEAAALMAEVAVLKQTLPALESEDKALTARLHDELARFPNLPDADVPEGADEAGNVEVSRWGTRRAASPSRRANMPTSVRRWVWISKLARQFPARALPSCVARWPGSSARWASSCST